MDIFFIEFNVRFSVSLTQMEALQQAPQIWTLKGQCQETEKGFSELSEYNIRFSVSLAQMKVLQ